MDFFVKIFRNTFAINSKDNNKILINILFEHQHHIMYASKNHTIKEKRKQRGYATLDIVVFIMSPNILYEIHMKAIEQELKMSRNTNFPNYNVVKKIIYSNKSSLSPTYTRVFCGGGP